MRLTFKHTSAWLVSAILFTLSALHAEVETYAIDTAHSSVGFKVRHFFTPVLGSFSQFSGTMKVDRNDLTASEIEASIDLTSIDTNNAKRDKHLQEEDYFHTAKYPSMAFKSTEWKADADNRFKVTGDLSFNGHTHTVTLDVKLLGFGDGMRGAKISGWEARGTIDRTKWGLTDGQPVVGNEVEIEILIEAHKQ